MKISKPLLSGRLRRRYKRFLADVALDEGEVTTVHCPNPGRMTSCLGDDWPVWVSDSQNPRRKLLHTLEMVHDGETWIGVNPNRANDLVEEGIRSGRIAELENVDCLEREVTQGSSRIDFRLQRDDEVIWVEVKAVTLKTSDGAVAFPDAVSKRGQKHLLELQSIVEGGERAIILFVAMRSDGEFFRPADEVDPEYGRLLREATGAGVECLAYQTRVAPPRIEIDRPLPTSWD